MKIRFKLFCLSVCIVVLVVRPTLAQGFPPANVNVESAKMIALSPVVAVSGTVVSQNNAEISAETSGRLTSLVAIGTQVLKGEVIAKIDDKQLSIQLKEAAAHLDNSKAHLRFLESEVLRKTQLFKQKLSPESELDKTISERDIAQGDLVIAQSRLEGIEQDLTYTKVRAPFSGVISQRLASLGEYVESGNSIVRLVELNHSEASVFAPIIALQYLKEAKQLFVKSPLGSGYADIKKIVPVANIHSHLMEVRLDMSSFDWPIGLSFKAQVANGSSETLLTVPRDALVLRRDGTSVFRIHKDAKGSVAQKVSVTVGAGMGGLVAITSANINTSIQAGDLMVIRGAERLRDGQAVVIKNNNNKLISHDNSIKSKVPDTKGN